MSDVKGPGSAVQTEPPRIPQLEGEDVRSGVDFEEGLRTRPVWVLAQQPGTRDVLADTYGGGVFRLRGAL